MIYLIIGLIVFFGMHSVASFATLKARFIAQIGAGPFKGVFAILSFIGLGLIIYGFGEARLDPVQLYDTPGWTRHLAFTLLLPVFVLVIAAYVPSRIRMVLKRPMLVAVKLWAVAHLIANGDLASVLLFGSFLAYAVMVRILYKRRLRAGLAQAPYDDEPADIIPIVLGVTLYVAFLLILHDVLIGVPLM